MEKIITANRWFFGAFIVLQIVIFCGIHFDGDMNRPWHLKEYLDAGGNTLDYYLGYNLFTSLDTGIYNRANQHLYRMLTAGLPLCVITFMWLRGLFPLKTEAEDIETQIDYMPGPASVAIGIVISLYYLYYSVIYISMFWLM